MGYALMRYPRHDTSSLSKLPIMNSTAVITHAIAAAIAFWAGSRWRHHTRTWSDHRQTAALAKELAARRWKTLLAALTALLLLAAYLTVNSLLAAGEPTKPRPAPACKTPGGRTLRSLPPCPMPT